MPKVPASLTDTAIKALKPNSKKCDGCNLYIVVKSDGTKWWKYDYIRPDGSGKRNSISFGIYPIASLKKARDKREATKILIKDGIDPSEDKKQNKIKEAVEAKNSSLTFQKVLGEYFEIIKVGLSIKHFEKIQRRFELDVLPLIGNKIMGDILHSELLSCIKRIEDRGAIETARRILNHCERIWKYAISTGQANYNITSNIDKATTLKKNS